MTAVSGADRRLRITVYRPQDPASPQPVVALDLPGLTADQFDQLRALVDGHLGPGFVAAVDGEIIARGPAAADPQAPRAAAAPPPGIDGMLEHTRRLTELAVQQHEYCYAELQRMRRDYEEEFAQERALLRALRERWLERVLDDKVRAEDAARYVFGVLGNAFPGKKADAQGGDEGETG